MITTGDGWLVSLSYLQQCWQVTSACCCTAALALLAAAALVLRSCWQCCCQKVVIMFVATMTSLSASTGPGRFDAGFAAAYMCVQQSRSAHMQRCVFVPIRHLARPRAALNKAYIRSHVLKHKYIDAELVSVWASCALILTTATMTKAHTESLPSLFCILKTQLPTGNTAVGGYKECCVLLQSHFSSCRSLLGGWW